MVFLLKQPTPHDMAIDMKSRVPILFTLLILATSTAQAQTGDTIFTVSQNPFPDSTHLTIHDLDNDTVTLKVYDVIGRVVANFFDSIVLSGTQTVTLSGDSLQDGTYFALLKKNSETHSRKLVKGLLVTGWTQMPSDPVSLKVYPNPTTGPLSIQTGLTIEGLEIYDAYGRQVLQRHSGMIGNIDMACFNDGLYLLHIKSTNGTYIERIIKQ